MWRSFAILTHCRFGRYTIGNPTRWFSTAKTFIFKYEGTELGSDNTSRSIPIIRNSAIFAGRLPTAFGALLFAFRPSLPPAPRRAYDNFSVGPQPKEIGDDISKDCSGSPIYGWNLSFATVVNGRGHAPGERGNTEELLQQDHLLPGGKITGLDII